MIEIEQLQKGKQIFFISDLHLPIWFSGAANDTHLEDKVVAWLDYIKPQAQSLFLLGDIFDFWFEYKYLIPKGALRFQAKLWEFHQEKIPVYFFVGNHDYWSKDYLIQRCGVELFKKETSITICNQRFLVGHGDSMHPSPYVALLLKFSYVLLQSMAKVLPADWLYGMVYHCSLKKISLKRIGFSKKRIVYSFIAKSK